MRRLAQQVEAAKVARRVCGEGKAVDAAARRPRAA
jgi:hypothetical protein